MHTSFSKLNQIWNFAKNQLQKNHISSYQLDAMLLVCHCFGVSKEQVIFNQEIAITQAQINNFTKLLNRRIDGEPMSHLLGRREFYGYEFLVNSNVLDPRPDSESLIEEIAKLFDPNSNLKILELGVGSGCLVITTLKLYKKATAVGVDISQKALEMAKKNAIKLEVSERLNLIQSNWFEAISGQKFDLIISNPPYIPTGEIENLQKEVRDFEPRNALDGGINGLDCYLKIAKNVRDYLNPGGFLPGGFLVLEIGQNQEKDIKEIFKKAGLKFILEKKDLAGIIRCLIFQNENN